MNVFARPDLLLLLGRHVLHPYVPRVLGHEIPNEYRVP